MGFEVLLKGKNLIRLFEGLGAALKISLISVVISIILGLILGMIMSLKKPVINAITRVYLEIVRIMPQMVLLFIVFFGFTRISGHNLSAEVSSVIVFSFWGTAEMGDLIRGALTSIPLHQTESAAALGLTKGQVYLYVLIPQTLRRLLPQAINLSTRIIKTTALVKMINVTEVLKVGQQIIGQFYRQPDAAFWVYFVIFLLYFLVCWPFSLLAKQLEKRWA